MSRGGRVTFCQSVLANLPTYYVSLFAMSINIESSLERLTRNFFWDGHTESKFNNLVKWAKVTRPQLDGGLGLGALQNKNRALLLSGAGGLRTKKLLYGDKSSEASTEKNPSTGTRWEIRATI